MLHLPDTVTMSLIFAMFSFSLAMSISPGPVNMIIVSSGANYGIRKTFAFVSGATTGFTMLLLFLALGFYKFVALYPFFLKYLAIAGSAFIIYMGYRIASAKAELNLKPQNIPTFSQGFLLQWLNPKAWIACVSGISMFSTPENTSIILVFTPMYFVICYLSLFSWSVLGSRITLLINNPGRLQAFNRFMGALLILTACYLLYTQLL